MRLVAIELDDAKAFVAQHHRHNHAPKIYWRFGVGLELDGTLVGVAMGGRPKGRWAPSERWVIEVIRCCTIGHKNACTMLYGAICRAAKALGYDEAITYTLASEDGASLRAAGFTAEAALPARGYGGGRPRYESNLLGESVRPEEAKVRWRRVLGQPHAVLALVSREAEASE